MKSKLIQTLGDLGGYQLARLATVRQPRILMYHRFNPVEKKHEVSAAVFEQQLKTIKRYFNPMTVAELAKLQRNNNRLPKYAIAITVDDGYRDFYEVAYPLLKHYDVPATFYVTTGFINGDIWLWPDQVTWLLNHKTKAASSEVLANKSFDLSETFSELWWPIVSHFLSVPNDDRLAGLKQLEIGAGVELPKKAPDIYSSVSWSELEEMQQNGIEIGGHTVTHPSLGHMLPQGAEQEIKQSMITLTERLGKLERSFCYPNGTPDDYSDIVKKLVSDAGYVAAVTCFSDKFNLDIPFAWRRFVGSEQTFQFNKSLFGVAQLGNNIRSTVRCGY
jgi:peptidoglycan/xylan/chitin deacetylase (PgdA/CDA1 family)